MLPIAIAPMREDGQREWENSSSTACLLVGYAAHLLDSSAQVRRRKGVRWGTAMSSSIEVLCR